MQIAISCYIDSKLKPELVFGHVNCLQLYSIFKEYILVLKLDFNIK